MTELDITQEWFQYANCDLSTARHLCTEVYPPQIEIACYLCQQAAEKALKGYLVHFTHEEPPRIHNLEMLCQKCMDRDSAFDALLAYCGDLNPFATETRYPGNKSIEITESAAKAAVYKADAVYTFCLSKIPELQ